MKKGKKKKRKIETKNNNNKSISIYLRTNMKNSVDRGGSDELSFNSVLHKNYDS